MESFPKSKIKYFAKCKFSEIQGRRKLLGIQNYEFPSKQPLCTFLQECVNKHCHTKDIQVVICKNAAVLDNSVKLTPYACP